MSEKNKILMGLAFIAGFTDTATFVGAQEMFSAHVTGNFVVFAANIFKTTELESYLRLLTFPIFALGVMLVGSLKQKFSLRIFLFLISVILMGGGIIAGQTGAYLMVFAMGIQNAVHKIFIQNSPTSTVMTGNVTNFFLETISSFKSPLYTQTFKAILFFLIGCLSGAYLTVHFGLSSVVFPGVGILLLNLSREAE